MCQTSLHTPSCSNRTRSGTDVASYRHISSHRERTHRILTVQNDYEVGDVGSDLETPADAPCCDAGGRGPGPVGETRDNEA